MAPTDALSAPGSVSYSSDRLTVGDGTWDFTKNNFLLPNLMGLPFDMMQYNGMGNRFATLTQYHSIIVAHGVLAVLVFLFLVPFAVMTARFYRGPVGRNVRYHVYFQILSIIMLTVVFVLGFFAVGPNRSLTNPHHGIGVALYVMLLVQAIGGVLVRHIRFKSLRLMFHRWLGRIITLLGVIQIPLGLTLYGSPKYTFILYAVWVAFLFLLYFVLSYRHELDWNRDDRSTVYGGRSEVGRSTIYNGRSEVGRSERSGWTSSGRTEEKEHGHGWLGPLAAGAAVLALFRGRKDRKERARSRSRSHSRSRGPEVLPSRPNSSYLDEKYVARDEARPKSGGFMSKFAGAVGAGALAGKFMGRKDKAHEDEYQSVATDTPKPKTKRPIRSEYTESEFSDEMTDFTRSRHGPILPGPGNSVSLAGAMSAADERPRQPVTPRQTHARTADSRLESNLDSDYSSYVSPSRKAKEEQEKESAAGVGTGVLGALGLGWFAKKLGGGGKDKTADEERGKYEEERRDGRHGSKFTADGYGSPGRRGSRRYPPTAGTQTTMTGDSELSSAVESQPAGYKRGFPPMPHSRPPPPPSSVDMPDVPSDKHGHGVLHQSETGSEAYGGRPQGRRSSRRRSRQTRDGSQAAAEEAAASAGLLAAEQERERARSSSRGPGQPVSVKLRYHDDRDRNITLRRLTEEEAARERRRRRSDSASSMSGGESSGRRRYRRDSDAHRSSSELTARNDASGRRGGNNAAYYPPNTSGPAPPPPPPPGPAPFLGPGGTHMQNIPTVSSVGSHGTWSAMSPSPSGPNDRIGTGGSTTTASAADRRKARRAERRQNPRPSLSGTDMYD